MEDLLNKFKIGYILVYKSKGGFFSDQIEKAQSKEGFPEEDSKYTHVELSLGGPYSVGALIPKVKIVDDIRDEHKGRYVKLVRPKISDYGRKRKNIAIHSLKRVNKVYGFTGVTWFLLKKIVKRNIFSAIGDFCAELVGYSLWKEYIESKKKTYEEVLPKLYNQLYPADFLNSDYFETVWEGYLER